ncbi:hypothetical protein CPB85DRAFT_1458396 [Mucidula mucida]|nr:hypothetical protein CPB85DRAFT_1458392 [Mucidula mucida]KAF8899837.1 hypothetical protein CPB85DRAFT_1458396 [Mucidula mucida]
MNWTCDTTVISRTDLEEAHNSRYQSKKRVCNAKRGMQPKPRYVLDPPVSRPSPSPSFVDPATRPPSNPAQVRGVLLEDNIGRDRFTVDISKFKTLEKSTRSSVATINDENTPPTIKAKTSLSSLFSIN